MVDSIHPNILALIAACFIASARTLYRAGVARLSPVVMNVIMAPVQVCFGTVFYFLEGGVADWPLGGILWFAAMGVSGSFIGRYLSLVGMKLVGLARSSIVTQTSLVWASLFAVVFAGERMTWIIAAGTLAIMMGSILLVYEKGEIQKRIPLYYYVVPLGTAILFAMTHLFGKFGLQVIKSASLGMTIASIMGFCSMLIVLSVTGEGRKAKSWDKKGLLAVLCGACLNAWPLFSSGRPLKQGTSFSLFRSTACRCCSSFSCPGCFSENKKRWAGVSSSAVSCPSWEPLGLFWANRFQEKVARPGGAIQFCSSRVPNADKVRAQNRFRVFVCMRGTPWWKSVSSSR